MERQLASELLDILPASDPQAQGSRRDLRRLNGCMGNARLAAARLAPVVLRAPPRRIVDLGASDGAFLLRLTQHLPALAPGTELVLVDRCRAADERVLDQLRARGFHPRVEQADAWDWLRSMPADSQTWVLANLFLHHFSAKKLRAAFASLAERAGLFCACEPRRASLPLAASRLVWFLGANAVTRHDAVVSVQAGFAGQELSALWPAIVDPGIPTRDKAYDTDTTSGGEIVSLSSGERVGVRASVSPHSSKFPALGQAGWHWQLSEKRAGWFSHLFLAERSARVAQVAP